MTWFYISFADDDGFLGGLYIDGDDLAGAVVHSHFLNENPGGEMLTFELPEGDLEANVPARDRRRLLTLEEIEDAVPWPQ